MKSFLILSTLSVVLGASAAVLPARDVSSESVWILACRAPRGGSLVSKLAYYSNLESSPAKPDAVAVASAVSLLNWSQSHTVRFADGEHFTANGLNYDAPIGKQAGTGQNDHVSFICFRADEKRGLPSVEDFCKPLFSCSHLAPDRPADIIAVKLRASANVVKMDNLGKSASEIYAMAYDDADDHFCSNSPKNIEGTDCSITFNCHGDIAGTTIKAMVETIKALGDADGYVKKEEVKVPGKLDQSAQCVRFGINCHNTLPTTKIVTSIPSQVEVLVVNQPPEGFGGNPSDQGQLTASISCPVVDRDCAACLKMAGIFSIPLAFGGFVPGAGPAFGVASAVISFVCQEVCS